jgi:hypothetical protein
VNVGGWICSPERIAAKLRGISLPINKLLVDDFG